MPKTPLPANAEAMPETLSTRRGALAAIAGASALAVGLGATAASAAEADAPLFDLIARWREAQAREAAAHDRFFDASGALLDFEPSARPHTMPSPRSAL